MKKRAVFSLILLGVMIFMVCGAHNYPEFKENHNIEDTSAFCSGFKEGYVDGYCYRVYGCVEPVPPVCPVPDIGENSWKDGYNRGFTRGLRDR